MKDGTFQKAVQDLQISAGDFHAKLPALELPANVSAEILAELESLIDSLSTIRATLTAISGSTPTFDNEILQPVEVTLDSGRRLLDPAKFLKGFVKADSYQNLIEGQERHPLDYKLVAAQVILAPSEDVCDAIRYLVFKGSPIEAVRLAKRLPLKEKVEVCKDIADIFLKDSCADNHKNIKNPYATWPAILVEMMHEVPELRRYVLNIGGKENFRYGGILTHAWEDRFSRMGRAGLIKVIDEVCSTGEPVTLAEREYVSFLLQHPSNVSGADADKINSGILRSFLGYAKTDEFKRAAITQLSHKGTYGDVVVLKQLANTDPSYRELTLDAAKRITDRDINLIMNGHGRCTLSQWFAEKRAIWTWPKSPAK